MPLLDDGRDRTSGEANHAQAITLNHARQIFSFYEHYSLSFADSLVYRDARAAENVKWWQRTIGGHDRLFGGEHPLHGGAASDLPFAGGNQDREPRGRRSA